MDPDTTPSRQVRPPPLNSDQLNYLIWRYLQEAGYGEAAVNLQRDWKVEVDNLPFAKHIKGQALISLVQKGLRYHHLSLTIDEHGQQTKRLEPSMYFFGPEDTRLENSARDDLIRKDTSSRMASPASTSRKRETESSNGMLDASNQPTKRSRKGAPNGTGSRKTSAPPPNQDRANSMDVDLINGQATLRNFRSPSAGEMLHDESITNGVHGGDRMDVDADAPSSAVSNRTASDQINAALPVLTHTLTNGESRGIQVVPAKVRNLVPSAMILSVAEKSPVTKAAWRPGDWSKLATSGHTFCGICQLTGQVTQNSGPRSSYKSLLGPDEANIVTAFAWKSNGTLLAIATYAEQGGQIHIFDGAELVLIETLPGSHRAITSLKWLPESALLTGLVPGEDGEADNAASASILTWDIAAMLQGQVTEPDSQEVPLHEGLVDLDVAESPDGGSIYVAGRHAIYRYPCRSRFTATEDKKSSDVRRYTSPADHTDGWSFVRCQNKGQTDEVVVAASTDSASIWLPHRDIYYPAAHKAPITGLELRPRLYSADESPSIPHFATSSVDGSIKIWNYSAQSNTLNSIHTLLIDRISPVMAISFSPDGFCLAGASYDEAYIWNAEHGYNLMASWKGEGSEWEGTTLKETEIRNDEHTSSINGDSGSGISEHGLAWDSDSKKLAFGLGSQVAVIDFQR